MGTCIIHPGLVYTIPIFPLLNRNIFHLLVSFLFFAPHCILNLMRGILLLPGAIYCCLRRVVGSVLCRYTNFHATIANMGQL